MAHLGQGDKITTVNSEKVVFTTDDGQQLTMNVRDLAKVIKPLIPTHGYFQCLPISGNRWRRILKLDLTAIGEVYSSFLYTGGSYTNSESCCMIVNIMIGDANQIVATRISGNEYKGSVTFAYKFEGRILQIWMQGTYSASGSTLMNLSSLNLPFEQIVETPPDEAINIPIQ